MQLVFKGVHWTAFIAAHLDKNDNFSNPQETHGKQRFIVQQKLSVNSRDKCWLYSADKASFGHQRDPCIAEDMQFTPSH